eukprot:868292-Heterocapsa_arctica.AAC.1
MMLRWRTGSSRAGARWGWCCPPPGPPPRFFWPRGPRLGDPKGLGHSLSVRADALWSRWMHVRADALWSRWM